MHSAVDARRVGAYAIGYRGESWASEVLNIDEFAGRGGGSYGSSLRLCGARFAFQSQMRYTYVGEDVHSLDSYLELSSVLE